MTHDKNIWFHWERNATFTPIFMCMEAWATPTTKYWGVSWPTSICVWKNDVISWNNKNEHFDKMGKKVVAKLLKVGLPYFEKEVEYTADKIRSLIKKLDEKDLSKMSEPELVSSFKELHSLYLHWFVLGVTEPPGFYGEKVLEKLVKDKKKFSILTSPTRKSFSRGELEDLLSVTNMSGLEAHAKKYFWLHNSYFTTEVLGASFFQDELNKLREKYPDAKSYLDGIEATDKATLVEKQNIIQELNFTEEERKIVSIMEFFAWFQDYRKEYTMIMLHYIDQLLEAIGKFHGLTLKEMKHILPSELFAGVFNKQLIAARMKHFMVIWDENAGKFEFFTKDEEIEQKKLELLGKKQETKEIVEIEGSIASHGRVRGVAFVTMSSQDAKNIKQGEILVTSMTSPDFIAGIKKAAAIVTNEGGILCHAAIIAREFGIPCIVGTSNATKLIKTGDLIEVDGNHGFVRILVK
ncbi:MAG: PEP-utilizing enzyme [Candidatus Micrarchaeota archaeon]|nr:PEP-utilizing enzyme [Candidatus Micrarchaeota archaeon]